MASSASSATALHGVSQHRRGPSPTSAPAKRPLTSLAVPAGTGGLALRRRAWAPALRASSARNCAACVPAPAEGDEEEAPLRVGIVGFGNFGQFIAQGIQRQGHTVMATSRTDYSAYCRRHGVQFFATAEEMCEQQPDVILLCSSILSTEAILRSIPLHKLKPDTIFADVLSVKQYPRNLFLEVHHHHPPLSSERRSSLPQLGT